MKSLIFLILLSPLTGFTQTSTLPSATTPTTQEDRVQLFVGRYCYFYDSESFRECGTNRRFEIEEKKLRDAYVNLRTEEKVTIVIQAREEMTENMMGERVPGLTLIKLISMKKEPCVTSESDN